MHRTYKYRAFGLNIESVFPIVQVQSSDFTEPDVRIQAADLSLTPKEERKLAGYQCTFFKVEDGYIFRITNGNLIQVDVSNAEYNAMLPVYLMGSCMGSILIQRGAMLLHGSCVTDGKHSILITGDSGAGKSTLASEFLSRGWRLVTDDVTTVLNTDPPTVQSSYPSQKLWKDAMDRYGKQDSNVHSLITTDNREKYGINVSELFFDGTVPLSAIVRLIPADHGTVLSPIEGFAKVDQLLKNTYRLYFLEERHRQRHFQRCVTLATKIPMALAVRENGKDCAPALYDMITKYLEEHCHD